MKKAKIITVFLVVAFLLIGCAAESGGLDFATKAVHQDDIDQDSPKADEAPANSNDGSGRGKKVSQNSQTVSLDKARNSPSDPGKIIERKIIRNAVLQLESTALDEAQQKITKIAESKKGFVVQSRKSTSQIRNRGHDTVSMTIRVPADKFRESLDEIRKTGSRVIDESVTGRDVTEEFIDIEAHLKTKKALEERFLEIMKRSNSVQDALNVERQLANVRGEIEKIEGRKRFLQNQASLSTIKVTLQTPTGISGSSSGFFYELNEAVSDGFDGALTFVLYLIRVVIALLPFLLLIVLPLLLLLRYFWRKYKTKKIARKFVEEELNDE